jgi:23S rRNA (guanosine2251-2'-O)-methyltransferase
MKNEQQENFMIVGRNSVLEAIKSGREIDRIIFKEGVIEGSLKMILAKAKWLGISIKLVPRTKMDKMAKGNNHQGVIAFCTSYSYSDIEDILLSANNKAELPFIILLDEITDPHNFGAIIRSAESFGAHGIICKKRRSSPVNATVAKVAEGSLENIKIARVSNLNVAIEKLKRNNIWVMAAKADGDDISKHNFNFADTGLALIIGSEGFGISRLVLKNSDFFIGIPMHGKIGSLNASVAASILIYDIFKIRNA